METRTLGDYTIIKQIGRGSLGTVYLAEHRFMKQQYALKVLSEDLASDRNFIQRFEEEVSRLTQLDHPHIVKIHNVSYAQGVYFLVTDCIVDSMNETTNLAQYLATHREPFEEEELLRMLRQIADALDYAHGRGQGEIVHRGLKLNNILIGRGRSGMELYISDFGLSKILGTGAVLTRLYRGLAEALGIAGDGVGADSTKLSTLHHSALQSFAFLAPEQKRTGDPRGVTAKADVYAFGLLAYHLITRQFPEGVFPMPSAVWPDSRYRWDAVVRLCLQSDPTQRPTMLLDALDEVEGEEAVAEPTPPRPAAQPYRPAAASPTPSPVGSAVRKIGQPYAPASPDLPKVTPYQVRPAQPVEQVASVAYSTPAPAATAVHAFTPPPTVRPMATPVAAPTVKEERQALGQMRHDTQVTAYQPEPKEVKHIEPIPTDMIAIEGGSYWRGSNDGSRDEMPRHLIRLTSFAVDVHPVTNEQFLLFLEFMQGEKDEQNHDMIILKDSRIKRSSGRLIIESGYSKHPVVGVTWYGAVAYAKWVGKRLPTEAEWEIAAKGGEDEIIYPTGQGIEKKQANFFSSDTTTVCSYPPNRFGLYDMAGNVYEWCADWYSYNYYETSLQEPDEPKGPLQGVYRVLRGGCWKSLVEDLRCAHRHRNNPGTVNGTYGFRCACDV